jgi:hypothetical protein
MLISAEELQSYFNKFIKPHISIDFIEKAMLIPYLPKEVLEKEYPEISKLNEYLNEAK